MNKKIITVFLIVTALAFLPVTSRADYPTGTLGYSDDIAVGNVYEWTVKTFDTTGDFAIYSSYFTIAGETLSQGSKIKLVITEDPDTAVGDWYEVYLDGVLIPGADLSGIADYTYGGDFINPVTYTNATGTYNIYQQVLEEWADENINTGYSTSDVFYGYTYEYKMSEVVEIKLKGDVFSVYVYNYAMMSIKGGGYDLSQYMEMEITTTVNINTGLVGKIEYMMGMDLTIYTASVAGTMHLLIDSGYANTPYNWAYSFLGITVIAAVVGLVKRRR